MVFAYIIRSSPRGRPSHPLAEGLWFFAYIIRSSPRGRPSHPLAEGLWSLHTSSALARAGGLRIP